MQKNTFMRNRLMATVSSFALAASVFGSATAAVADESVPSVWIDFSGQIDSMKHSGNPDLPLGPLVPQSGLTGPLMLKIDPSHSDTGDAKITYQPDDSWLFSASVQFGRTARSGKLSQALAPIPTTSFVTYHTGLPFPYSSIHTTQRTSVKVSKQKLTGDLSDSETHLILDFQAGKDVGLGIFGSGSTSVLSAGVRFAHFMASRAVSNFHETNNIHFATSQYNVPIFTGVTWHHTMGREIWNTISASGSVSQKFVGLGPSIQWQASAPLWNDPRGGDISFDWGANAALLFGKQTKTIHHQSSSEGHCFGRGCAAYSPSTSADTASTSKNITIPNVGGFAAVSLNYSDIKVALGYRADLFIDAADVGFAIRKSSNLLFHGPYASLSIGFSD